jgi:hypothetical protein
MSPDATSEDGEYICIVMPKDGSHTRKQGQTQRFFSVLVFTHHAGYM